MRYNIIKSFIYKDKVVEIFQIQLKRATIIFAFAESELGEGQFYSETAGNVREGIRKAKEIIDSY